MPGDQSDPPRLQKELIIINTYEYRNSPLGRARRELAFARDDLRVAQHRLASEYVSIFPHTSSPEVDEAVRELSRAHRAYKAAKDAVTRAEHQAMQEASHPSVNPTFGDAA